MQSEVAMGALLGIYIGPGANEWSWDFIPSFCSSLTLVPLSSD